MMSAARYVPSRYISMAFQPDGSLLLHSSRTGAVGSVPAPDADRVRQALRPQAVAIGPLDGIFVDLEKGGFLVPEGTDERLLAHNHYVRRYSARQLHLIVMPTERCNFRCVYCYQTFERGTMSPALRQGLIRYVRAQRLDELVLTWFGGEPLMAKDVVIEVTRALAEHCRSVGCTFAASATTNGWYLEPALAEELIGLGVSRFQVTLDGVEHDHDQRRVGGHGAGTFQKIVANLRYLRSTSHAFLVSLRHNFDPKSLERAEQFVAFLAQEFGGDPRFAPNFHPVGRWGGPNDSVLDVCDQRASVDGWIRLRRLALGSQLGNYMALESTQPNGNVCYAANPRSFVIGSDGRIYKCTVELDYHDRNVVGLLNPDGSMDLDWRKMALWCETNGMEAGKKCMSCYFSPACHGAACPKEWLDLDDCTCPPDKQKVRDSLPLIPLEAVIARRRMPSSLEECAR